MINYDGTYLPRSYIYGKARHISIDGEQGQVQANIQIRRDGDALSVHSGSQKNQKARKKKTSVGKSGDKANQTKKGKKKMGESLDDDERIRNNIDLHWAKYDPKGRNTILFFDCINFSKDLLKSLGDLPFDDQRFDKVYMKLSGGSYENIIKKDDIPKLVKMLLGNEDLG